MGRNTQLTAEEMVRRYQKELKNVRIMRWLTLAVYLLLLWRFAPKLDLTLAVISVLLFVGAMWFLQAMGAHQFVLLQEVLHRNCDAVKYAKIMELLSVEKHKDAQVIRLCWAKGLFFAGDFEEAEKVLGSVYVEKPGVNTALLYRNIAFNCALEGKRLEDARKEREETGKLLSTAGKKEVGMVRQQLIQMDAALALEEERYEDFFPLQEKVLRAAVAPMQRVVAQYRMALAELIQGETDSARERLEEVAEDGGTIYVAAEAENLLSDFGNFEE
ncbi:MAG: hypothetical protein E7429_03550 [Ruminococcaceae bacterium]|nr:hypothetical protein [Oscillospiraceae bacterium]